LISPRPESIAGDPADERTARAEGESLMAIAEILLAECTPISDMGVKKRVAG
jgi:hypothetical protein